MPLIRDNLLENWYWIGGGSQQGGSRFPINTRGGYTVLEYIESTGTQYINTGYIPTANTKHVSTAMILATTNYEAIFGAKGTSFCVQRFGTNPAVYAELRGAGSSGTATIQISDNVKYTFSLDAATSSFAVDDTVKTFTAGTTAPTTPIWIFAKQNGGGEGLDISGSLQRHYQDKIYDGATLVRNMIPVRRNSDSVLGMYDTVNNVFYTNAGTGTFIAGFPTGETVGPSSQTYTGGGLTIDRWNVDSSLTINSDYITVSNGTLMQERSAAEFIKLYGKTVTASVLKSDGTLLTGTVDFPSSFIDSGSGMMWVTYCSGISAVQYAENAHGQIIRIDPGSYCAAKLELGDTQTLAHKENGVWVLNEIPNFEIERLRCITDFMAWDTFANKTIATTADIAAAIG